MSTFDAIILGGGAGSRFAANSFADPQALPKQFQMLAGYPVLIHGLRAIASLPGFRSAVIAVPEGYQKQTQDLLDKYWNRPHLPVRVVSGGKERQDSSRLALQALEEMVSHPERVLIHDACRPFLPKDFLSRILKAVDDRAFAAWVPTIPVTDTLKQIAENVVTETLDRSRIFRAQTPQVFEFSVIHALASKTEHPPEFRFTDDASLCEYYGIPVGIFEGDVRNIKLTYSFESETLRGLLTSMEEPTCASESVSTSTV